MFLTGKIECKYTSQKCLFTDLVSFCVSFKESGPLVYFINFCLLLFFSRILLLFLFFLTSSENYFNFIQIKLRIGLGQPKQQAEMRPTSASE